MSGRLFVLIVTNDSRLERQALLAVRAAGCLPMLGHADEECPAMIRRTLPDVLLIDTAHPSASAAGFYEEVAALGVRVVALAPDARDDQVRAMAGGPNLGRVTLPAEYDNFRDTLGQAQLT